MTDNEIAKTLEYCISNIFQNCLICPLHNDFYPNLCHCERDKNALDLINRQKAEIERLKHHCFGIQNELEAYKDTFNTAIDEAKSEAIKEFAERLENDYSDILHGAYGVEVREIKNLAKDMTEVDGK